jgi:hypothetical protein
MSLKTSGPGLRALLLCSAGVLTLLAMPIERRAKAQDASRAGEQVRAPEEAASAGLSSAPEPDRQFDGTWTATNESATCTNKSGTFRLVVTGGVVKGGPRSGRVSPSGAVIWTSPARKDAHPIKWTRTLRGKSGSGTFSRQDGRCSGTFAARRG